MGDINGTTPLHYSAGNHKIEVLKLLVAAKADINARDKDGKTPLDIATKVGDQEAIKILTDAAKKNFYFLE